MQAIDHNELNLSTFQTITLLKSIHKDQLEIEHIQIRHKTTNKAYLLKKILKPRNPRILEPIIQQYNLLKRLNHPNIIKAYSSKQTDNQLYLLYQYLPRELNNEYRTMSEEESAMIILQISDALEYLHSQSIIHRYINLSSIMVLGSGMDIRIKLKDFTHSGSMMTSGSIRCETIDSLAPEIIENQVQNQKADVWGLGIVMYMLHCKNHPFIGNGKMGMEFNRQSIKRCNVVYPQGIPEDIRYILEKIFILSPLLRLTITEIVSHQYFKQYKQKQEQIQQKQYLQQKVLTLERQLQDMKSNQYKSKQIKQLQQKLLSLQREYALALQNHDNERHKLKQSELKCIKLQKQKRSVYEYRMNLQKSKLQLNKINNNIILIVEQNKKIKSRTKQLQNEVHVLKNKDNYQKLSRSKSNKSNSSINKHIINEKLKQLREVKKSGSSKGRMPPLSHSKSSKILY